VTLAATSTPYEGFLLQARQRNSDAMSYGSFDLSTSTNEAQTLNCFGQTNDVSVLTVVHFSLFGLLLFLCYPTIDLT